MIKRPTSPRAAPKPRHGVIAYIALLLAFGAAFSWTSWQAERERDLKSLSALVELGEKSVDTYFAQIESALRVLSENVRGPDGGVDLERAGSALKLFERVYPDLGVVIVMRPDGQVVASADAARGAKLPTKANEPSFVLAREELMRGVTLSVGRAFYGPLSRQWIIPLRYGVRDGKSNLLFVVAAGVPLAKPQSLWKDAPLPPGAALGLVRDDSFLVGRYPVPVDVELVNVYGTPRTGSAFMTMLERQEFPVGGTFEGRSGLSGLNTVYVFRRLAHYPLTMYAANPTANIWAVWWQKVQVSYLLMLVLGAGGIAVYRWLNQRQAAWDREREHRMRELEDANRELQAFSHTVAHDLRAPLRHIDGYVNLWKERASGPADAGGVPFADKISAAATRMGRLIDDLLAFSRTARTELNLTSVELAPVVAEVVRDLRPDLQERAVEWRIGALPTVRADRSLLRQVLFNLVENAVKYTRQRAAARIEISSEQKDGNAIIMVRDNGVGFDMKYAHKLFKVFERLHGEQEFAGTGIGLATVARIVQRHGGRVWAQGETGQGAVFFVALPATGEA